MRSDLEHASGAEVRRAVREGGWRTTTHGLARGYVQTNLAIVPERYAFDFLRFAQRNPKPCPIVDVTDPGDREAKLAARGSDIATDLPGYAVYRDGKFAGNRTDIVDLWRPDHVAFLLGCSLSMDEVLLREGVPQRHLEYEGGRLSVYKSNLQCRESGVFRGPVVVSMRPIPGSKVARAVEVTSRYPATHGGPVHVGDPSAIGIEDLSKVDWGKYNPPGPGEVPVFWACGVTPQAVAMAAKIPEMITHAAGHMFVTDLKLDEIVQ